MAASAVVAAPTRRCPAAVAAAGSAVAGRRDCDDPPPSDRTRDTVASGDARAVVERELRAAPAVAALRAAGRGTLDRDRVRGGDARRARAARLPARPV